MSLKDQINQLFKEIEVYSSQALYKLAMEKCIELSEVVKNSDQFRHKDSLLEAISRKIGSIEKEANYFDGINLSTRMTNKEIDIVKSLILTSNDDGKGAANWEIANAFMVLGQFENALQEFNKFIENNYKIVSSAKNVLRCLIEISDVDGAASTYRKWSKTDIFTSEQMESIETFFVKLLDKKNISAEILEKNINRVENDEISQNEEYINIIKIKLYLNGKIGEELEFILDVDEQRGDTISVVISEKEKRLLKYLEIGKNIKKAEFISSSIVFMDSCIVADKKRIESGIKKGDYCVDITIIESE